MNISELKLDKIFVIGPSFFLKQKRFYLIKKGKPFFETCIRAAVNLLSDSVT